MMIRYAAGFLFSEDRQSVALVRKQKPAFMVGKLNAIGGKIEADEEPGAAMEREFWEEAGVADIKWEPVAVLQGPDFVVHFFAAFDPKIIFVRTMEYEQIEVHSVAALLGGSDTMMSNLPTLLTIALDESGIAKPVLLNDSVSQERKAA